MSRIFFLVLATLNFSVQQSQSSSRYNFDIGAGFSTGSANSSPGRLDLILIARSPELKVVRLVYTLFVFTLFLVSIKITVSNSTRLGWSFSKLMLFEVVFHTHCHRCLVGYWVLGLVLVSLRFFSFPERF